MLQHTETYFTVHFCVFNTGAKVIGVMIKQNRQNLAAARINQIIFI